MGKASASKARGPGFEPPWLVQWSRWESRPLSLVGNGAGAVTHPIDRAGSVFPRGTGRFLVKKGVRIASFRCLSEATLSFGFPDRGPQANHARQWLGSTGASLLVTFPARTRHLYHKHWCQTVGRAVKKLPRPGGEETPPPTWFLCLLRLLIRPVLLPRPSSCPA